MGCVWLGGRGLFTKEKFKRFFFKFYEGFFSNSLSFFLKIPSLTKFFKRWFLDGKLLSFWKIYWVFWGTFFRLDFFKMSKNSQAEVGFYVIFSVKPLKNNIFFTKFTKNFWHLYFGCLWTDLDEILTIDTKLNLVGTRSFKKSP